MNDSEEQFLTLAADALAALQKDEGHLGVLRGLVESFQAEQSEQMRVIGRKLAIINFLAEQRAPHLTQIVDHLVETTLEIIRSGKAHCEGEDFSGLGTGSRTFLSDSLAAPCFESTF